MNESKQLQILFNLQKQLIGYFSKHLSLLLLIPALLGGIWQIIELSHLSFSYIRFFSPSQVLADGLLILLLLVSFLGTFYILLSIHKHYINTDSIEDNNNLESTVEVSSKTSYGRCIWLFVFYLVLLFLEFYILSKILEKPDSFFTILIVFPVVTIILYVALIAWMYSNLSIINTWFYQKILRHTIWFWITTIVFSFLFTVSSFRNAFMEFLPLSRLIN
jgi:hypothetical protein